MTVIDRTGASDAEFEARIAPFEADVETLARAMCAVADFTTWDLLHPADVDHYRRLAAAAIAALPPSPAEDRYGPTCALCGVPCGGHLTSCVHAAPSPAEEAVKRVEALAEELVDVANDYRHATSGSHDAGARNAHYAIARHIRAALASPAPPPRDRYAQCDNTCTVDCGACKGAGPS